MAWHGMAQLRAEGGFLVSASRTMSATQFVRFAWHPHLHTAAASPPSGGGGGGGPSGGDGQRLSVVFEVPNDGAWASGPDAPPRAVPSSVLVESAGIGLPGVWRLSLAPGEHAVLYPSSMATQPSFVIRPQAGNRSEYHWFGYNRQMKPLH
jgi:hypothetical protein